MSRFPHVSLVLLALSLSPMAACVKKQDKSEQKNFKAQKGHLWWKKESVLLSLSAGPATNRDLPRLPPASDAKGDKPLQANLDGDAELTNVETTQGHDHYRCFYQSEDSKDPFSKVMRYTPHSVPLSLLVREVLADEKIAEVGRVWQKTAVRLSQEYLRANEDDKINQAIGAFVGMAVCMVSSGGVLLPLCVSGVAGSETDNLKKLNSRVKQRTEIRMLEIMKRENTKLTRLNMADLNGVMEHALALSQKEGANAGLGASSCRSPDELRTAPEVIEASADFAKVTGSEGATVHH